MTSNLKNETSVTFFLVNTLFQDGIGDLRIFQGGMHLKGDAAFLNGLRTSKLTSPRKKSIRIESGQNFTVATRDSNGRVINEMNLGTFKNFFLKKLSNK